MMSGTLQRCVAALEHIQRASFLTTRTTRLNNQIQNLPIARMASSPATTDLCDHYMESPGRLLVVEPGKFKDFGGMKAFSGKIETIRCFESNPLVRKTLGEEGDQRVLVVDGGGSQRVAIMGDQLASLAQQNNWSGLVVNGCIRDSAVVRTIPVGVKALNTHPLKSAKSHLGERGSAVSFAGVEFVPGHYLYADEVRSSFATSEQINNPRLTHLLRRTESLSQKRH